MGHSEELCQNIVHWRRKWQTTPVFLLQEPHEQYEKVKRYTLEDELRKLEGVQYVTEKELRAPERLTAPERRKELGQSRNDTQLWMCLVVKVKSFAVKNNTAQESEMLGPLIKVNWTRSSRRC